MRNSSYTFLPILLKLHRCFGHGLKTCMWFGYNPQIRFCHFFRNFQALLLSTYVDRMYLVRVTPRMNFTFSDDIIKKKLRSFKSKENIHKKEVGPYHGFGY